MQRKFSENMKRILITFVGLLAVANATLEDLNFDISKEVSNTLDAVAQDASLIKEWVEYKLKYGKEYISKTEDDSRFHRFMKSKNYIEEHNKRFENGSETFKVGLNRFADFSDDEFLAISNPFASMEHILNNSIPFLGHTLRDPLSALLPRATNRSRSRRAAGTQIPVSFDWRQMNKVTDVKDQKNCPVCWAFSTSACVESHYAIKTSNLMSLSPQNLADCTKSGSENKCRPNNLYSPLEYIRRIGIMTDADYQFQIPGGNCKFNPNKSILKIRDYIVGTLPTENAIRNFLFTRGPLIVNIASQPESFKLYDSGVYRSSECSNFKTTDHFVTIVGYGIDLETNLNYWLFKNSHGTEWGENGYMRIISSGYHCHIGEVYAYPIL